MTPTPDDSAAHAQLAALRQLKEMLDAGTITPQEFDTLKQRLLYGGAGPVPAVPATPAPLAPPPLTPYLDTPAALTPEATPLLAPEPDWGAAPSSPAPAAAAEPAEFDDEPTELAERRNPLNLVFAIGGLVLFLGVMAYLAFGRRNVADEHITSATQTAADTTLVQPEVGPQAEQLTLPPAAAPETVRVAPALPPPTTALPASDSVPLRATPAATPAPTAPAATTPATPAPKAAAKPTTPVTPAAADTASNRL